VLKYGLFKKPKWLPTRVYDDGRKTYIQLAPWVLQTESPVLFNNGYERINYRVHENIIVIDELIDKVRLVCGKERVTVEKKRHK
jgi:type IV secretion system protein VirB9